MRATAAALRLQGIALLGPMPASVQITTTFSAGLCRSSTQPGAVRERGIVNPDGATGARALPGSSSMNMSFSGVRGRSSALASVWTRPRTS